MTVNIGALFHITAIPIWRALVLENDQPHRERELLGTASVDQITSGSVTRPPDIGLVCHDRRRVRQRGPRVGDPVSDRSRGDACVQPQLPGSCAARAGPGDPAGAAETWAVNPR